MEQFEAKLELIGINPFVPVPGAVLEKIFSQAGKSKGHIPIMGLVNGKSYRQTLVRYKGAWRLYVNTSMLKNSPKRIGERITISVAFDPSNRTITPHPALVAALNADMEAKAIFEDLAPSRQKEIVRYISFLKSDASISNNIQKVIGFLSGKNKFLGSWVQNN